MYAVKRCAAEGYVQSPGCLWWRERDAYRMARLRVGCFAKLRHTASLRCDLVMLRQDRELADGFITHLECAGQSAYNKRQH